MGVLFAVLALLCWGLGDFLIQRSTRAFGDWVALFFITLIGSLGLFPFVLDDLAALGVGSPSFWLLLGMSIVLLVVALLDFEALRVGKLSVVEPIYALEVPIATTLAGIILHERLSILQYVLVVGVIIGILLVTIKAFHHLRKIHLERGIHLAILATIGMGSVNFLFGVGSRATDPLLVNWFTSFCILLITTSYLIARKRTHEILRDWRQHRRLILGVGIFDNGAWISYAISTTHIPIAIATSISESYVALAATLGLIFNREKLRRHQLIGLILAATSAIALALVTAE